MKTFIITILAIIVVGYITCTIYDWIYWNNKYGRLEKLLLSYQKAHEQTNSVSGDIVGWEELPGMTYQYCSDSANISGEIPEWYNYQYENKQLKNQTNQINERTK